ncbi:MAG: matrixin family metalloprotease [Candidatus Gastranaerophilales bacterium]|nr:matrixin family metalloprotease [Candidatus Gastranaerophilales bacterium]
MKKVFISFILLSISTVVFAQNVDNQVLKQTILYEDYGNYLQNSLYEGKYILRWNKAYFPIKVYVEPALDVPVYYSDSFLKALKIWQNNLGKIAVFKLVTESEGADISVFLVNKDNSMPQNCINGNTEIACVEPVIKKQKLKKMYIKMYKKDNENKFYSPNLVLNTAVHELGHALGIMGHSNDPNSIMFNAKISQLEQMQPIINTEDITTLKLLYMTQPDITNNDKNKEKRNIDADTMFSTLSEKHDSVVLNAINEARVLKEDSSAFLRLAYIYQGMHDYDDMLKYLKLAKENAKTQEELYNAYIGFSSYYTDKDNTVKAVWYLVRAHLSKNKKLVFMVE